MLEDILSDYKKFSEFQKNYKFNNKGKNTENFEEDSFTNPTKLENRIRSKFEYILPEFANEIEVTLKKTEKEIRDEIEPFFPTIYQFILRYVVNKNNILSRYLDEVIAIEKPYNSQVLGLKGKVDILCSTKSSSLKKLLAQKIPKDYNSHRDKQEENLVLVPIELKTGNRMAQNVPDKFQVVMYFLMIMEQMRNLHNLDEAPFAFGLLVYLQIDKNDQNKNNNARNKNINFSQLICEVNPMRIDLVNLFVKRNLLVKTKIVIFLFNLLNLFN